VYISAKGKIAKRLQEMLDRKQIKNDKYLNNSFEGHTMTKKSRPSSFKKGDDVIYEGKYTKIQVPSGPSGTVGVVVNGKVRMVSAGSVTKVTESVIGMSNIAGLTRMRELAGIVKEDDGMGMDMEVPPMDDPLIDMPVDGSADLEMVPDMSSPAMSPRASVPPPPPAPAVAPVPLSPVGDFSLEYKEAVDSLDHLSKLVMDMKISEFKLFLDKAESFHEKVREIGHQFLDTGFDNSAIDPSV